MTESCPHEGSLTRALKTGEWNEGLRSHVSGCSYCSEVEQVARWMGGVAEQLGQDSTLPAPEIAWLRAQLEERQALLNQAMMPAVAGRAAARIVAGLVLALAALWAWPSVDVFVGLLGDTARQFAVNAMQEPATFYTVPVLVGLTGLLTWIFRNNPLLKAVR